MLHTRFSAALVQDSSTAAQHTHTHARTAAPPGCASKQWRPLPLGDATARWRGGRSGRHIATPNPFVRSRGGARQCGGAARGARGSVPGKPAWSGPAPARGLERQNRKRRPRLIHSLRARGSKRVATRSRGCGTWTPVSCSPICGASPCSHPFP